MVSKAADRSNKVRADTSPLSIASKISFWTDSRAVSVECKVLYADWSGLSRLKLVIWFLICVATAFSVILEIKFKFDTGR